SAPSWLVDSWRNISAIYNDPVTGESRRHPKDSTGNFTGPNLGRVSLSFVPGDWSILTAIGFNAIIASRVCFLLARLDLVDAEFLEAEAEALELIGRLSAGLSSDAAAYEIQSAVVAQMAAIRGASQIPIFVDLVGHSRGGSVAAQVLRKLQSSS